MSSTIQTSNQSGIPGLNFSLLPAIFPPFSGIPPKYAGNTPKTDTERLALVLSNLDQHHAAVKAHMHYLTVQQEERIETDGREAILAEWVMGMSQGKSIQEQELRNGLGWEMEGEEEENLLRQLKAPHLKDAPKAFYELGYVGEREDTEIGNVNIAQREGVELGKTCTDIVREETARRLRSFFIKRTKEIEEYSQRAETLTADYRKALARNRGKEGRPDVNRVVTKPAVRAIPTTTFASSTESLNGRSYQKPAEILQPDLGATMFLGTNSPGNEDQKSTNVLPPHMTTNSVDKSRDPRLRSS